MIWIKKQNIDSLGGAVFFEIKVISWNLDESRFFARERLDWGNDQRHQELLTVFVFLSKCKNDWFSLRVIQHNFWNQIHQLINGNIYPKIDAFSWKYSLHKLIKKKYRDILKETGRVVFSHCCLQSNFKKVHPMIVLKDKIWKARHSSKLSLTPQL